MDRVANEDYKVRNSSHVIQKGTPVIISMMGIQNDPDIYPNPHVFDPDRMSQEKMRQRHPSAFLSLGGGPRVCIGSRFGYLLVKLALVSLLAQFRFRINRRTKQVPRTTNFITELSIEEDIWLDVQRI